MVVGRWVNDEVINEYIKALNNKLTEIKKNIKVINSLFSTTVLAKDEEKILKALEKQGVQKFTYLIFVIFCKNHWFFVDIDQKRVNVYDSIKKKVETYLKM